MQQFLAQCRYINARYGQGIRGPKGGDVSDIGDRPIPRLSYRVDSYGTDNDDKDKMLSRLLYNRVEVQEY